MELSHNSEMRAEWLSLWNGGDISSDRSGVHRFAEATGMSSFGNVQPDRLAELMAPDKAGSASGDGLWCRDLFCRPKELPYRFNEIEADLAAYLTPLFGRIDSMPSTDFKLSKEAKLAGARLWESLSVDSQGVNAAEAAFLGKLRGYSVRLAGILHILCLAVAVKIRPRTPLSMLNASIGLQFVLITSANNGSRSMPNLVMLPCLSVSPESSKR